MRCFAGLGEDMMPLIMYVHPSHQRKMEMESLLSCIISFSGCTSFVKIKQNPFMSLLLSSWVRYKACRMVPDMRFDEESL